jgi:hypothetical protein
MPEHLNALRRLTGSWALLVVVLLTFVSTVPAQLLGGLGSRSDQMRQRMSDNNTSIHYDPSVLAIGNSRQ